MEELNVAGSLKVEFGGVWVGAASHLIFTPDRNGDGKPKVLLDGWLQGCTMCLHSQILAGPAPPLRNVFP
ncbi:MAG: hypothetical protein GY826_37900 [Fuerstiella sp.]|jgi:hypothetical protein|nr:hypothetical protein [Fuerstiella sp.]